MTCSNFILLHQTHIMQCNTQKWKSVDSKRSGRLGKRNKFSPPVKVCRTEMAVCVPLLPCASLSIIISSYYPITKHNITFSEWEKEREMLFEENFSEWQMEMMAYLCDVCLRRIKKLGLIECINSIMIIGNGYMDARTTSVVFLSRNIFLFCFLAFLDCEEREKNENILRHG